MVGCVLKEDHPASSMYKAPRALGHPEEHWVVVVGCPVRQCLLLFQALADMVDFRAQDHSFSLQRFSLLGGAGGF